MTAHNSPAAPAAVDQSQPRRTGFFALALGSVGVVYGDIGTSPLYAFKESVVAAGPNAVTDHGVLIGVCSLMLWALMIVVTLKYVLIMLRADNQGEGGILSLMALARGAFDRSAGFILLLGMLGAALFYADAVITPAISVLSAVEGLSLVTPAFSSFVLPICYVILIGLFAAQSRGTARIGAWFGPITLIWFITLFMSGFISLLQAPAILQAINPLHGASFLIQHGTVGFIVLGAVFLTVTGAEALYADLGHFGAGPIKFAWSVIVLPALAMNYLGQGALLMTDPAALESPFYRLFPEWMLIPIVILAAMATVIASQAVISGAFSMTRQAIQLGILPRFAIRRTSETEAGQIYIAGVNWLLLAAVIYVVFTFGNSSALASAYGIAVTGTMILTSLLAILVIWKVWKWRLAAAIALFTPFIFIDVVFLGSNMLKLFHGGWLPLTLGALIVIIMLTWQRGSRILLDLMRRDDVQLADLLPQLEAEHLARAQGTAVFLTATPDMVPAALLHNLKHNKTLHTRNVILSIETDSAPRVEDSRRLELTPLTGSLYAIRLRFGFMEAPDVPAALQLAKAQGLELDLMQTSFFLSRRVLIPSTRTAMPRWMNHLFIALAANAHDASTYFNIPSGRVVHVGTQIAL